MMMKPPGMAAASGPTLADAAALARDAASGRFIGTDGQGRSAVERRVIAARRAEVARLYPDKTIAEIHDEIGPEFNCSRATIAKDVVALELERRPPGARRKYPDPEPRICPNPGCPRDGEPFTPPSWEPEQRYCCIPCARSDASPLVRETARELKTAARRRADAEIARLNAAGYVTSRQLADERKVTESVVSRWISRGALGAKRRIIEGEPHQLIARVEVDRFNREEWPRICRRMGRGFPPMGGPRRRLWSRRLRAPIVGLIHKPHYTDDQAKLVRKIKATYPTWGRVRIAEVVSKNTGKPLTPEQVRGILRKTA